MNFNTTFLCLLWEFFFYSEITQIRHVLLRGFFILCIDFYVDSGFSVIKYRKEESGSSSCELNCILLTLIVSSRIILVPFFTLDHIILCILIITFDSVRLFVLI